MNRILVFPDNSGGKPIKRDKLEEFLKSVKSNVVVQYIADNADLSRMIMTLGTVCQKLFNELEELKEKTKGVEQI